MSPAIAGIAPARLRRHSRKPRLTGPGGGSELSRLGEVQHELFEERRPPLLKAGDAFPERVGWAHERVCFVYLEVASSTL